MAAYTTTTLVQAILGADYGALPDGSSPDLQPRIDSAHVVVLRVNACAARKGITLSSDELEIIERWLAAHYYTRTDPTYTTRSTGGSSGGFTSPKDDPERYKKTAQEMDYSGCLKAILDRQTARVVWLGKPVSEQIRYNQRD